VDERRWDDLEHRRPAAFTWQDVSVVTQGPVVAAA
jgi:phosphatidylserine/phosphatidylglycerophosphate/cardiolipin synthase-like enzyme